MEIKIDKTYFKLVPPPPSPQQSEPEDDIENMFDDKKDLTLDDLAEMLDQMEQDNNKSEKSSKEKKSEQGKPQSGQGQPSQERTGNPGQLQEMDGAKSESSNGEPSLSEILAQLETINNISEYEESTTTSGELDEEHGLDGEFKLNNSESSSGGNGKTSITEKIRGGSKKRWQ